MAHAAGHFLARRVVTHGDHVLIMQGIPQDRPRFRQHEVTEGKYPDQLVVLVHHVGIIGDFHILFHAPPDQRNGFVHRDVLLKQDDLGVHDAARRIGIERQQVAELFGVVAVKVAQEDVAVPFFQLVQNVGGIVGRHLGDDLGGLVGIEVFQNVDGDFLIKLGEGLGRFVGRQMAEQANLLLEAQVFQMLGHVSRVGILGFAVFQILNALGEGTLAGIVGRPVAFPPRRFPVFFPPFLLRAPRYAVRGCLFLFGGRIRHGPILLHLNRITPQGCQRLR